MIFVDIFSKFAFYKYAKKKDVLNQPNYSSALLENAVNEFAKLPGIGRKTALRLVLHLLKKEQTEVDSFGNSIIQLRSDIVYCKVCHNISDTDVCSICSNPARDSSTVCVVETIKDVMSIENTQQYRGLYHVLGGVISPMDGVGPADLEIESLAKKAANGSIKEIILAVSATMEGDTTNFYIFRKLAPYNLKITTIARGVSVGSELEFTDEVTLGRSILNRVEFTNSYK